MRFLLTAFLASICVAPVAAQEASVTPLSLEHRMLVRCSAAFAMVAFRQDRGEEEALRYPRLSERGEEFFVRSSAQVMDEAGLTIEEIAVVHEREAQELWDNQQVYEIMPVCLTLLPPE